MPRKRKRKKPAQDDYVSYLIEIKAWDWGYGFGAKARRGSDDPYMEFRYLELTGSLIRPKSVKAKGVHLFLTPDKALNKEYWDSTKSETVGVLRLHDDKLQGLLSLPDDALAPIISALGADALHYAVIDSTKLRYRKAPVRSFRLERTYDPEDYPPED